MSSHTALARVPLFAHVSEPLLARLADRAQPRVVADGDIVAVRGRPAEHLIVVESGALLAEYDDIDGRRLRLGHFRGPCAVDKVALLDPGGYTATWRAAGTSAVRMVPRGDVLQLVDDVAAVRRHVLSELARQVRNHQTERVRASHDDATARIADWLVHAAAEQGRRVTLAGGQQGLGERLGVTRVTVNRVLSQLSRDGLVRVQRGALVVLAPELLAHRARLDP